MQKFGAEIARVSKLERVGALGPVEIQDSHESLGVIQARDGTIRFERRPMGEDGISLLGKAERSWTKRQRQSTVLGVGALDRPHRQSLARSSGAFRQVEHRVQALQRLVEGRRFQADFRGGLGRSGHGIRDGRRDNRQGPPSRSGRKRGTLSQAIGKSKGGMTTKILALADALGNLVKFVLLPGHRFDTVGVTPLIENQDFDALIADKAFDSDAILAELNERGAKIVISQHPRRSQPLKIDLEIYKWRHLIENFFCRLKEFKRVAMRADKTDRNFEAIIYLVAATINSR